MCCDFAQTINELRYQREDCRGRKRGHIESRYRAGDQVTFIFNGLPKTGRVTAAMRKDGSVTYNILTRSGQWFQRIPQDAITGYAV